MATDWTLPFQDLAAKAAEAYAHQVTHSQDLLAKVYRGELAPFALQHLPDFLRERGTRFYGDFNQLTFEFFSGLMKLSAKYSDQYFRGLNPEEGELEQVSAIEEEPTLQDSTRLYLILNTYVAGQNSRVAERYHRLLERIAKGEITPSAIQDYTRQFNQEIGPAYAREAGQLNFRFFEGIVRLNQRYNDEFFRTVSTNGHRAQEEEAPAEPVYLEMEGPIGTVVVGSIIVENNKTDRATISCSVSEFRNTDGTSPAFAAPIEVDHAYFTLRSGESQTVNLRLTLKDELFTVGKTYAATVIIRGQGDQDILAFLIVKPSGA